MRSGHLRLRPPLIVLLATVLLAPSAVAQERPAESEADALDPLRERFRAGLEKFRAGAFAEAILIWETIYRELGPDKGYRLAFNLARAYEQFGDPRRAAESYDAYVTSVARRREANEQLEPNVEKQEGDALARLAELSQSLGRIHFTAGRSAVVRIDGAGERVGPAAGWIAYVTPGKPHVVTFDPGTPAQRNFEVNVARGEQVELSPPTLTETPTPRATAAPRPPEPIEQQDNRPFPVGVIYVGAGIAVLSTALPIALYAHANGIRSDYDVAAGQAEASRTAGDTSAYAMAETRGRTLGADYDEARTTAHVALAVPIVLGAATAGLAAWWLFGPKGSRASAFVAPMTNGFFGGARF